MTNDTTPATDDSWGYANRVANDQFVARCKQRVIELMPFTYPDVGMLIARIEALQSEITALKTAPELVGQLADELERTRSGFPSEYEIYKCLIDSARSALSAQEPKVCPEGACPSCWGTGNVMISHVNQCSTCHGAGVIKIKEE